MNRLQIIITLSSAGAFLFYGAACIFTGKMIKEFQRFGLTNNQRVLTGVLQLMGAIGLVVGLWFPLFGLMAAFGLSLLMLMGFMVRIKIRDSMWLSLPSFTFMIINTWLTYHFYLSLKIL